MFTEAQLERMLEIRRAVYAKADLKSIHLKPDDIELLVERIDDLTEPDHMLGADELMRWVCKRLVEDLNEKREFLADTLEQMRVAELQVKEAEHALAAVKALIDGDIYASGGEIIKRWDDMAALYASQGMLPVPKPALTEEPDPEPEAPSAEGDPEPEVPNWPDEAVATMVAKPTPELVINRIPDAPKPPSAPSLSAEEQDRLMYDALKSAAGDQPEVQVSIAVLSEKSGVANGSTLTVLRRLAAAGRIEIISDKPQSGAPRPNIYRFTPPVIISAPPIDEPASPEESPEPVVTPVAPAVVAEKLAAAWGAKVKPSGAVSQSAPLRERILGVLSKSACTTSGLASMLDVKELAICQTLEAMKHEGTVQTDEMPEGGRRAQLWRQAQPSAA